MSAEHKAPNYASVGVLLPNIEAKIVDPETGKELGTHQSGKKGLAVMDE